MPVGTIVRDAETRIQLKDLSAPGDRVCVAKGGRGGRGNSAFKSALNQAPRKFEAGRPGERREILLELKLIADVGLVGLAERRQIDADLEGLARDAEDRGLPVHDAASAPRHRGAAGVRAPLRDDGHSGTDRGRAPGEGLGTRFLRHVERTRVLVHLIDLFP